MVALSLFEVKEGGGPIYKSEADINIFKGHLEPFTFSLAIFQEITHLRLGQSWEAFPGPCSTQSPVYMNEMLLARCPPETLNGTLW